MITETDQEAIRSICQKYGIKRALLFGSSVEATREARDIDLAVEGVAPEDFFRFYGDLMFAVSKPIDIVDLSGHSKFLDLIRREGVALYG
jgi:predicted nucleotidyltransferase